jgi:hypothetical protein
MSVETSIKISLSELLEIIKNSLPKNLADFLLDFILMAEWGLALETVYDYLDDNEIPISRHTYNLIKQIADAMEINTRDWCSLECQIQSE